MTATVSASPPPAAPIAPAAGTFAGRIAVVLEMIKFPHTVFALPFALTGMWLAAGGPPQGRALLWVAAAMVGARSAALAFNRVADRRLDAANPRTADRALPAGRLSVRFAWGFTACSAALFVLAAAMLNPLCVALTPLALAVILGYSYCKRFTAASHFVLGLALGMAPVGGWLAVSGSFALPPLLLCAAVATWTAGFDILYACQDIDFDRRSGLHSIPARLGAAAALRLARGLHAAMVAALLALAPAMELGGVYLAGVAAAAALLLTVHALVSPSDLRRLDLAFFRVNAWVGVAVFAFTAADLWVRS